VRIKKGSRRCGDDPLLGDHPVHAVADGGDARVRSGEALRPVPRARAARLRRQAGPLDRRAAAAHRRGRRLHRLHGHRRQVPAEVLYSRLPRRHADKDQLLDHDLRWHPPVPLTAPQLQLHHPRITRGRRNVPQVWLYIYIHLLLLLLFLFVIN
jgi:hypothetical protein